VLRAALSAWPAGAEGEAAAVPLVAAKLVI